jgi:hypothetical protein
MVQVMIQRPTNTEMEGNDRQLKLVESLWPSDVTQVYPGCCTCITYVCAPSECRRGVTFNPQKLGKLCDTKETSRKGLFAYRWRDNRVCMIGQLGCHEKDNVSIVVFFFSMRSVHTLTSFIFIFMTHRALASHCLPIDNFPRKSRRQH